MIEDGLEEEPLEEFKGGTLTINSEAKSTDGSAAIAKSDKNDNSTSPTANNNSAQWSTNFVLPLTTIPHKITETLWNRNKPKQDSNRNNTLQPAICITEDPNNFFTFRESVIARALTECKDQFLDEESDGPLLEAFLLTQISSWNSDKERLILLTPRTLVVVKYDFIALKRLSYKKLPLDMVDEVVAGELVYPSGSLIPRMNGLADGLSYVLETCLFSKWSKSEGKPLTNFYQPRYWRISLTFSNNRNMKGVRLAWNKDKPGSFGGQWNPFNEDIPFCTFTYHPLYFHKDCENENIRNFYNLELFIDKLCLSLADLPRNRNPTTACTIQEGDIILQNYLNIGSVIHNRNSLGFFKVRGKFSF